MKLCNLRFLLILCVLIFPQISFSAEKPENEIIVEENDEKKAND